MSRTDTQPEFRCSKNREHTWPANEEQDNTKCPECGADWRTIEYPINVKPAKGLRGDSA
jgi:hypothetical protein